MRGLRITKCCASVVRSISGHLWAGEERGGLEFSWRRTTSSMLEGWGVAMNHEWDPSIQTVVGQNSRDTCRRRHLRQPPSHNQIYVSPPM